MDNGLKKKLINLLLEEKKKEYLCHIQYVVEIGLSIAKGYDVDIDVIETACLLHDIGRDKEFLGEKHNQSGKRITENILRETDFTEEQKQKIYACILAHNSDKIPESIEEQIVRSADGGSKVEYHEAFMLMCKKTTYEERLAWGIKYLDDGFDSISIESYRDTVKNKYNSIYTIYKRINDMI